jgi:hypothetical protein
LPTACTVSASPEPHVFWMKRKLPGSVLQQLKKVVLIPAVLHSFPFPLNMYKAPWQSPVEGSTVPSL